MEARLDVDVKSSVPWFQRVGRGAFAGAAPVQHSMVRQIGELDQTVRDQWCQRFLTIPFDRFEAIIGALLHPPVITG